MGEINIKTKKIIQRNFESRSVKQLNQKKEIFPINF